MLQLLWPTCSNCASEYLKNIQCNINKALVGIGYIDCKSSHCVEVDITPGTGLNLKDDLSKFYGFSSSTIYKNEKSTSSTMIKSVWFMMRLCRKALEAAAI